MAADFARPNIGNKIKEDIPGLYDILLRIQADTMRKYLDILEIRGKIEKINLVD